MCDKVNMRYMEEYFPRLNDVSSVLEVGSYNVNGNFKRFFETRGIDYVGVDIQRGPDVDLVCDLENPQQVGDVFQGRRFDLVSCANVLEHVFQPLKVLENMKLLVREGGYIVIMVPVLWNLHAFPHDYYRLNPDFFSKAAEVFGLRIVDDSLVFGVENTRKLYRKTDQYPMIPEILNDRPIRKWLLSCLARSVKELRACWPYTNLSLIYENLPARESSR